MFTLSLLSRGHGKLGQDKQKLEVYFEPEVSLTAEERHILEVGEECSMFPLGRKTMCVLVCVVSEVAGSLEDGPSSFMKLKKITPFS